MNQNALGLATVDGLWQQLKNAQLVCVPGIKCTHRTDGGASWWLIQAPGAENQYRIDDLTHAVLQRLNGRISLEKICLNEQLTVSEHELAEQFSRLIEIGIVRPVSNGIAAPEEPQPRPAKRSFNPTGFVFFTFNPDPLLRKLSPLCRLLFNPLFAVIWCVMIGLGVFLWLDHHTELSAYLTMRAADPLYIFWFWAVYPILKAVHEVAHGLAVWQGGGRVRKAGLMLLVFIPVPFVDASDSSHFSSKRQRMLVAAAGMMAEMLLAAVGLLVWCMSEQAILQEIGFIVAVTGSISTVLFNANPLLRFDGYYLFSDWIEVPNLASRAQLLLRYILFTRVFGLQVEKSIDYQPREMKWLLLYGPAALCYRLFIIMVIAALVSDYLLWLGVCIAVWALWVQLFKPLGCFAYDLWQTARHQRRVQRVVYAMLVAFMLVMGILFIPFQMTLIAKGVIVLPERSQLRSITEGTVTQLHVPSGRHINQGDLVLALRNPDLLAQRDKLRAELKIKENIRHSALLGEPQRAPLLLEQIASLQKELDHVNDKVAGLAIHASQSGVLVIDRWQDFEGRYVNKGELLGFVYQPGAFEVQVVVSVAQAERLKREGVTAQVRFASYPDHTITVKNIRAVPQAIHYLPDAVLGSAYGGDLLVDMTDDSKVKMIHPMIQFNLELPIDSADELLADDAFDNRVPAKTVLIKFNHSPHSFAGELVYRLREFLFEKML
ncbi:efflux RND transporter periplasmic adaptor subunit [Amphritea sp. 1_MG-2023]|uniref:HlyD family efflux transporter periplasmic adaptor subunit n=1 Tax=Amphritea sp. 1_MG-2023 TaxID=3062670 RepID=UPI0026E1B243|nr:HlyD family efflux transporter periplasmic adaptor subunit [Amphritea sp. 1_MG-2023]MDO6563308.1 efflux RND transporter periplasmic adaptor subunit [Amphritea sp. 1_MG-2023]